MSSQINSLLEGESCSTTRFSFENRVLTQIIAFDVLNETPGFYVVFQPPEPFRNWNLLVSLPIRICCAHQPSARMSTRESSLTAGREPTLIKRGTHNTDWDQTALSHHKQPKHATTGPAPPKPAQFSRYLMLSIQHRHPGEGFHPIIQLCPSGTFQVFAADGQERLRVRSSSWGAGGNIPRPSGIWIRSSYSTVFHTLALCFV